ncbi:hypothetical protein BKA64DRAFT_200726 [Cadophora sp. MPI-SDFR-AT-0126]|nr:hypothetical protein BKA64DRAFT_200726 [Leotiomycetes sp. MPI-SDFR-AT-0126]
MIREFYQSIFWKCNKYFGLSTHMFASFKPAGFSIFPLVKTATLPLSFQFTTYMPLTTTFEPAKSYHYLLTQMILDSVIVFPASTLFSSVWQAIRKKYFVHKSRASLPLLDFRFHALGGGVSLRNS